MKFCKTFACRRLVQNEFSPDCLVCVHDEKGIYHSHPFSSCHHHTPMMIAAEERTAGARMQKIDNGSPSSRSLSADSLPAQLSAALALPPPHHLQPLSTLAKHLANKRRSAATPHLPVIERASLSRALLIIITTAFSVCVLVCACLCLSGCVRQCL